MKIRLYSKGGETVVKYAQKKSTKFVKIVNTSLCVHDTIINVKTPQYIIYFLLHPIISEIPSPKRTVPPDCPFYLQKKKIRFCDIQSDKFFMKKIA